MYGETLVALLYEKGEVLFVYPYRAVFRRLASDECPELENVYVRCLFSAPKKRFKHAVDRNRLKRQMREAYRKNKHALVNFCSEGGGQLHLSIQYVGQKLEPSTFMEKKMIALLTKLQERLSKKKENDGRTE